MKIGIASPISINVLKNYLNDLKSSDLLLGLGGTSVNNIIIGLLEQGHYVSVYTLDKKVKRNNPKILKGKNLTIYIGQFRTFKGFLRYAFLDFMNFESSQIKTFILRDKPDIVNAHWSYEYAIGTIKSKVPHLITFRDNAPTILKLMPNTYRLIRLLMDNWVRKNTQNATVNSPYLQKCLKKINFIKIIPNPLNNKIDLSNPKKLIDKKAKIISILNGWSNIKNPKNGIRSFQLLKQSLINYKLEYHIYGPGYEQNSMGHKWCIKNNLDKDVYFHGSSSHDLLMCELDKYDILLHPSKEESFGNTLIEAMAKGIPVIGGKYTGAVPWVLNYGNNGVLVDITKPIGIANGIKLLIEDKELYYKLSETGLRYVKENFSNEIITQKYLNEYLKIIKNE